MTPEQQARWDRIFATREKRDGTDHEARMEGQRRRYKQRAERPVPRCTFESPVRHSTGGRCL